MRPAQPGSRLRSRPEFLRPDAQPPRQPIAARSGLPAPGSSARGGARARECPAGRDGGGGQTPAAREDPRRAGAGQTPGGGRRRALGMHFAPLGPWGGAPGQQSKLRKSSLECGLNLSVVEFPQKLAEMGFPVLFLS